MRKFSILFLGLFLINGLNAQVSILPKPNSIKINAGIFRYNKGVDLKIIRGDEPTKLLFQQLSAFVKSKKISVIQFSPTTITLNLLQAKSSDVLDESYSLSVTQNSIAISSFTNAGLFYGLQTLFQIIKGDSLNALPCMEISDKPAYAYRGFELDVSRHFFSADVIKQYLDVMAKLKMNQFHWHLTDDQGWRIEIKKYPLLTKTGGCRTEKNGSQTCGFYTQEEIKQIVQYAKERYINVIPEIDIPGHASAAVASYPVLGCTQQQISVPYTWGVKEDVLCPSDSSIKFIKDVLDEVCALFPGKYIHIGGDETPTKQWEESVGGKTFTADKNISAKDFKSYFIGEAEKYLTSKGKKCIAWGEVTDGKFSKDMVIESGHSPAPGLKAAAQGNDVILTSRSNTYLDNMQDWDDPKNAMYMLFMPIDKVYGWDPAAAVKDENQKAHVIGSEACVSTEYINTPDDLIYQVFPRVVALAECFWTNKSNKKYSDFDRRLKSQRSYLMQEPDQPDIDMVRFKTKKK